MNVVFYIAAAIAIAATVMVITRLSAVHALIYLVLSLLAVAVMFFALGAPFIAALEVIVYAGAIMVLFVFTIMMLNLGPASVQRERRLLHPAMWIFPSLLAVVLLVETGVLLMKIGPATSSGAVVSPHQVGMSLFGPYLLVVELASMLLLAALVGAYHIGRRITTEVPDGRRSD